MNRRRRDRLKAVVVLGVAVATGSVCVGPVPIGVACPMCAESLEDGAVQPSPDAAFAAGPSQTSGGSLARGYFWSILFMLAMPFLLLTALVTMLLVARRGCQAAEPLG